MSDVDRQYSVGLVGLGAIGFGYDAALPGNFVLTHARAVSVNPATSLSWGIDPDDHQRESFQRQYEVSAFPSLTSISGEQSPDILILATPPSTRLESLDEINILRPKVMIIEKPLGESLEESTRAIQQLRELNFPVVVNYTRRFCPGTAEARKQIAAGELGIFRTGVVRYKDGVLRNASHLVNLIVHLLGDNGDVIEVGQITDRDDSGDANAFFRLRIGGGEVSFIPANVDNYSFADVDLLFENGRVQFENHAFEARIATGIHDLPTSGFRELNDSVPVECKCVNRYQETTLNEIILRLRNGAGFESELDDAEATEKICHRVLQ